MKNFLYHPVNNAFLKIIAVLPISVHLWSYSEKNIVGFVLLIVLPYHGVFPECVRLCCYWNMVLDLPSLPHTHPAFPSFAIFCWFPDSFIYRKSLSFDSLTMGFWVYDGVKWDTFSRNWTSNFEFWSFSGSVVYGMVCSLDTGYATYTHTTIVFHFQYNIK